MHPIPLTYLWVYLQLEWTVLGVWQVPVSGTYTFKFLYLRAFFHISGSLHSNVRRLKPRSTTNLMSQENSANEARINGQTPQLPTLTGIILSHVLRVPQWKLWQWPSEIVTHKRTLFFYPSHLAFSSHLLGICDHLPYKLAPKSSSQALLFSGTLTKIGGNNAS